MKNILLTVFFFVFGLGFSQQISPVPDMYQCNNEVFDLTTRIPEIMGNEDPNNSQVTFYITVADASTGTNAIANPNAFILSSWPQQTVYARLDDLQTGSFSLYSFNLFIGSGSYHHDSMTVCSQYVLETLPAGLSFYTHPGGGGNPLPPGSSVTENAIIYVYGQEGTNTCIIDTYFYVTILNSGIPPLEDVVTCTGYIFQPLISGNYYSMPGGPLTPGNTQYNVGTLLTESATIYVYATPTDGSCVYEDSFTVTITSGETLTENPQTLTSCELEQNSGIGVFNLWQLAPANNHYAQFYLSWEGSQGVDLITTPEYFLNTQPNQTVYMQTTFDFCTYTVTPIQLVANTCSGEAGVSGIVHFDDERNGCDADDQPLSGMLLACNIGNAVFYTFTEADGSYHFYNLPQGSGYVWITNINSQNYLFDLQYATIDYTGAPITQNFCVTTPEPFSDLAVYVYPNNLPRPGFETSYVVGAYNLGNVTEQNGTISLTYDPALLTVTYADGGTVNGNTITWTYEDILPGNGVWHYVNFLVATPPTVNLGTLISVGAAVTVSGTDVNPENNTFNYDIVATNSYDPNDIHVHEGEWITEAQTDEFLNYTVRFQNTGTANAERVRVVVAVDDNLDIDTFQSITSSHGYRVNRTDGMLEFVFDNINLAYESADEAASHGYISFRIKPAATVGVGDSMSQSAAIYFDFNEPIITNTVTTTVTTVSGTQTVNANVFNMYPNPAKGFVVVTPAALNATATVIITDVLGKELITTRVAGNNNTIDIASLQSGIYMVTVKTGSGQATQKLVVK